MYNVCITSTPNSDDTYRNVLTFIGLKNEGHLVEIHSEGREILSSLFEPKHAGRDTWQHLWSSLYLQSL